eukprot:6986694-Alexandrium_andersonii.AAC.1
MGFKAAPSSVSATAPARPSLSASKASPARGEPAGYPDVAGQQLATSSGVVAPHKTRSLDRALKVAR